MNGYFTNTTKPMNLKSNKISHREELVNILGKSVHRINLANFDSISTLNFSKVIESRKFLKASYINKLKPS